MITNLPKKIKNAKLHLEVKNSIKETDVLVIGTTHKEFLNSNFKK